MAKEEKRFKRVYNQNEIMAGGSEIWVDRVTKVCYLYHVAGNSGGLTVLVSADGTPQLWREPLED